MKHYLHLLLMPLIVPMFVLGISFIFPPTKKCPIRGDSPQLKLQRLDSLKNRSIISDKINKNITLDSILKPGDDTQRWSVNDVADIIGYVYDVQYGQPESCECHHKEKQDLDIHIELVKDLKDFDKTKRMIVEINRFFRASDKSLDYDVVKLLKGKKVEILGNLFFDEEHFQNSYNINPKGGNIWRATCWELHPVFYIKEVK